MGTRDLINLGLSPDSGTGDSARKGGAKINDLFADVYQNFGDNPIGTDNSQPFYGYRRNFGEFEYRVGELHGTGKFQRVGFRTTGIDSDTAGSGTRFFDSETGYKIFSDSDGDGIPDLYLDSEMYFLSRGEQIDVDLSGIENARRVNLVLPLAEIGDIVRIRESRESFSAGKEINMWTTPFKFSDSDQRVEWSQATSGNGTTYPNSNHTKLRDYNGSFQNCAAKSVADSEGFLNYNIAFGGSIASGGYASSPVKLRTNSTVYEFVYCGHDIGWVFNTSEVRTSTSTTTVSYQDAWDSEQWHQLTTAITVDGSTEVANGYYVLPLTRGTSGSQRDFESVTKLMNFKVYKRSYQTDNKTAVETEFLDVIRTQLYNAIDAESDSETDKAVRFKTVWGSQGEAAGSNTAGYSGNSYAGFADVDDMYKEITVSNIVDDSGNIIIFSEKPFIGSAVIQYLG
jgi:hypothetical protein